MQVPKQSILREKRINTNLFDSNIRISSVWKRIKY